MKTSGLKTALAIFSLAAATAATPADSRAQKSSTESSVNYSVDVATGARLFLRNMNGNVRIESGDIDKLQINAVKSWKTGNADAVKVEISRYGQDDRDILVCGMWDKATLSCAPDSYIVNNDGRNDTRLDFVVTVPRRMNVTAETVNGTVRISGVDGAVHGSVVNGALIVAVADDTNANVSVSSLNGRFESDFPFAFSGRTLRGSRTGKLGTGGQTISLASVNGEIRLLKR